MAASSAAAPAEPLPPGARADTLAGTEARMPLARRSRRHPATADRALEIVMTRLTDRILFVTGAASGIGRATALRLASDGARLFLTDIDADGLEETRKLVTERGAEVVCRRTDVSDEDDAGASIADCVAQYERLDVLCNIAGVIQFEHLDRTPFEVWRRILSVNLDGTFLMCRAALPHLVETRGAIINMGSTAGLMGLAFGGAYGASKGGVHALTRAIAVEYSKQGVRCNAICPASIDTAMMRPHFPQGADQALLERSSSLHGVRAPEVVADLVAFLASDEALHISGEEIRIDGAALA